MNTSTIKQPKIAVGIRIDYDLWMKLQQLRKEMDRSQIWLIENALRQTYVNQPDTEQSK